MFNLKKKNRYNKVKMKNKKIKWIRIFILKFAIYAKKNSNKK